MVNHDDPNWTWYGPNPPRNSAGGQPPEPTCAECDKVIEDWEPEMRLCVECQELANEWVCPVCRGTRSVQPDRHSPPEECPRCVDPDEDGSLR